MSVKKKESKINLKQIVDVGNKSEEIGNDQYKKYKESNKNECAKIAISAFRNTLYANSLIIKANKLD